MARSKAEVRELAARRSEMGPGKPYWKTPEGSTGAGAGMGTVGSSRRIGKEADEAWDVEGVVVLVAVIVCVSSCRRGPPKLYTAAAPTAADAPATIARVNLDMLFAASGIGSWEFRRRGIRICMIFYHRTLAAIMYES